MATVHDIAQYIDSIAPGYMAESWDNVGLLCGDAWQTVHKILVALDPFENVCAEAIKMGADLIVTHHPLIFVAPKSVTEDTSVGRSIRMLCRNNISTINAHTNFDCAPGGVNDVLARTLGLSEISVVNPVGKDAQGLPYGLLRSGTISPTPLPDFLAQVKNALGTPVLRYVDGGKPVCKVAVGGGACASELMDAFDAGCDTFVTSDIKYNQFWDAQDLGINLIDAGHFYTENPAAKVLAEKLQEKFPEIQVNFSQNHADCMKFF